MDCYGKQPTIEDIRAEKAEKFAELSSKKGTREYDEWFLNYKPSVQKKETKKSDSKKILNDKDIIHSPNLKSRNKSVIKNRKKRSPTKRKTRKTPKINEYLF